MTIVIAILIFFLLIFVHETGHLVVAKLTGVQVNEFSLGMGPKAFGFRKGETEYTFRVLPIGGACVMEGEDEESDNPRAFTNKPARVKAVVLVAGSLMNITLAIVVMSLVIFHAGELLTTVDAVDASSPAAADGLRASDKIVAIDDYAVEEWEDISVAIKEVVLEKAAYAPAAPAEGSGIITPSGIPIALTIERDGSEMEIATELYYDTQGTLKIGITPMIGHSIGYFFKSFVYGAQDTWGMTVMMGQVLGELVTGRADMDTLTGPVGIVVVVGDSVQYGAPYVWYLVALISLNLGIFNLIPFPALDGGRLLFLVIRKLTGKTITDHAEGIVHFVGIMILFGFMIFITVRDVDRFFLS